MTIYEKYDLKEVINASGKMTILGVSKVSKKVQEVQNIAGESFFEIADLIDKTGSHISRLLDVEDAAIVSSASAGIVQSVAGIIGKGNLHHLYHPYESGIKQNEIILAKGHNVDYGTGVDLMIAQGGGKVVEAGYANMCTKSHMEMMITENTAAILYIKSHHTVQKSMLSIEEALDVARRNNIPLIIDAAAEEDLLWYANLDADLVIFSGAKAIEGPSSGLIIGKKKFIEWVKLQNKGLGRSMKIGKENILGLTQAIEDYLTFGSESGEQMKERLEPFVKELNTITGISARLIQDAAGREIYRAEVTVNSPEINAVAVISKLKSSNPAIYTREYRGNSGIIEFDIRAVDTIEMEKIIDALREIVVN